MCVCVHDDMEVDRLARLVLAASAGGDDLAVRMEVGMHHVSGDEGPIHAGSGDGIVRRVVTGGHGTV